MEVKIKLVHPDAKIPCKASKGDACYDVYAVSREELFPNCWKYGLGFQLEIPAGMQVDLRARSSVYKKGLILANGVGTGDEGYRGEYSVVFYHVNPCAPESIYEIGDRVAQMQLKFHHDVMFTVSTDLAASERGVGGFGSTGLK